VSYLNALSDLLRGWEPMFTTATFFGGFLWWARTYTREKKERVTREAEIKARTRIQVNALLAVLDRAVALPDLETRGSLWPAVKAVRRELDANAPLLRDAVNLQMTSDIASVHALCLNMHEAMEAFDDAMGSNIKAARLKRLAALQQEAAAIAANIRSRLS
jgi:hypothetical protein